MIKVPANFQVNQIIGSLAINRPVMYVKRSKIVTMRPPLWIFFEIQIFFSFFIHMNHSASKNTKKSVVFKKVLIYSKSPLSKPAAQSCGFV